MATEMPTRWTAELKTATDAISRGDFVAAGEICKSILKSDPVCLEPRRMLVFMSRRNGRHEQAISLARQCVQLRPRSAVDHFLLGECLRDANRSVDAAGSFAQAISLDPNHVPSLVALGTLHASQQRFDEAIDLLNRALGIAPGYIAAMNNLALVHLQRNDYSAAVDLLQRAGEIDPKSGASANLGSILIEMGRVDQAVDVLQKTVPLEGPLGNAQRSLLFAMLCSDRFSDRQVFEANQLWAQKLPAQPVTTFAGHSRDPERRIRIGYVSADFRNHAMQYFIEPILTHHDRNSFEITCYSGVTAPDAITQRLREKSRHWKDIAWLNDAAFANIVRQDQIDILIDLSSHSAGSRLTAFALKPAPIQITYLGYAASTGLPAMDYRITDSQNDPPGMTEQLHTEQLIRLPDVYCCYRPDDASPQVSADCHQPGAIVFGSFNRLSKITPTVVSVWSNIMKALSGSRLTLMAGALADPKVREDFWARFAAHEIAPHRLVLHGPGTIGEYLSRMNRIDIGLDTFPFNGGTTTCHSLWMGVPVITLARSAPIGRTGVSILHAVGLDDLVASSQEEYVERAVALAGDLSRRQVLRRELRQKMKSSPLCEAPRFTANLETELRQIWRQWCGSKT